MPLAPGDRLGPYEIVALLGAGGMGEVYRGRDTRLGRDVALKVISPARVGDASLRRRFELEARAASALNHPSIVTIYDVGETEGVSWIAMEWVDGRTLRHALSDGPLPLHEAVSIARQVADGLAAAHAKGIVHRDLKPENVMITAERRAKVLDFGLARVSRDEPAEGLSEAATLEAPPEATRAGTILGTVGYMSPEQAAGRPVDFRSDQFSFGLIVYEALTGRRAFAHPTAVETLAAIIREDPRPAGESVSTSALVEIEYGISERWSASVGIPHVWAKYTGAQPPPSGLPVDKCACWNSSFADFGFSARYRLGTEAWAVTPLVRYGYPSHDYAYQGEAVVGRNLKELQLGLAAGVKLGGFLSRATVQATYGYSFVESPLEDVSIDKSTLLLDLGYAATSRLYVRAFGTGVYTHGGLRAGSPTGNPFPFPGELAPIGGEKWLQRDRLLATRYWQIGAGLSYPLGPVDLFASYSNYVWGRDAHNGWSLNLGTTWYFER